MNNQRETIKAKICLGGQKAKDVRKESFFSGDYLIDCLRKKKRFSTIPFLAHTHNQIQGRINNQCNQIRQNGLILTNQINSSINKMPKDVNFLIKTHITDSYMLSIKKDIDVLNKEEKSKIYLLSDKTKRKRKSNPVLLNNDQIVWKT